MNYTVESTMNMLRALSRSGQIKIGRNWADYVADQITKAASRSSLLSVVEAFAQAVQADVEYISSPVAANLMQCVNSPDAPGVISWLRKNPNVAAMILTIGKRAKGEEDEAKYVQALNEITITPADNMGVAMPGRPPSIPFILQCQSPLAHGSDRKAGNSTLFRRIEVLSTTGKTLTLPHFGANAIRGILRDELADDFTRRLGLEPSRSNPPYADWFFAALYNGGKLEENSEESKALSKELGTSGTMRVKGIHRFRDMVPPLSVMGVSLGNRILCRHGFDNLDAIPRCMEWRTGDIPEAELFTWIFITRQDNSETRPVVGEKEKSGQMIANLEVLKQGVILDCGIDVLAGQTAIELACVGKALQLFAQRGKIGANNRHGCGAVAVTFPDGYPDPTPYEEYLAVNKPVIMNYLHEIGALKTYESSQLDLTSPLQAA